MEICATVFTPSHIWVTDRGTHFCNEVMQALADSFSVHHNPTVAYAPWDNGTIERIMSPILPSVKIMLVEYKLGPQHWSVALPAVATSQNASPLQCLAKNVLCGEPRISQE